MYKFCTSDSFPKLHLIVLSLGNFNYNLTLYICGSHSPLIPSEYSCKDTFSIISEIKISSMTGNSFFLTFTCLIAGTSDLMMEDGIFKTFW